MTAAAVHRTRHALCGGIREIPNEVANCPNCAGTIYYVDTVEDTFERQSRTWFCPSCAGGGDITLTIRARRGSTPHQAPVRAVPRHHQRVSV